MIPHLPRRGLLFVSFFTLLPLNVVIVTVVSIIEFKK